MERFDQKDGFIWLNGEIINWRDAQIHVMTHGLHYGSCVFEGLRIYNKVAFKLQEHMQRLLDSAIILDMKSPYNLEQLCCATNNIIAKQNIINGYVRPFIWRGSNMPTTISSPNTEICAAIACWSSTPKEYKENEGLRLVTSKWRRVPPECMPHASKCAGMYPTATLAKHEALAQNFDDALMLDWRGYIAESTSSNIFLVVDNELHTPLADCFLNGITRQTIIDIAKNIGIKTHERHIKPEELANASEVFLTGSAMELAPVISIDAYQFHSRNIKNKLHLAYKQYIANYDMAC
jgi:branched-chain amino acid aminotransferase